MHVILWWTIQFDLLLGLSNPLGKMHLGAKSFLQGKLTFIRFRIDLHVDKGAKKPFFIFMEMDANLSMVLSRLEQTIEKNDPIRRDDVDLYGFCRMPVIPLDRADKKGELTKMSQRR